MDYITKPISRVELRTIANWLRKVFKCNDKYCFDVIDAFERIHSIFDNITVEIVDDDDETNFRKEIPSQCTPDMKGNYHIQVRENIYLGACDGVGGYRAHILHEICHAILCMLGYTPLLQSSFENNTIEKRYTSMEWQAKALCGEILVPYEETKGLSKNEIITYCIVSEQCANMRLKLNDDVDDE